MVISRYAWIQVMVISKVLACECVLHLLCKLVAILCDALFFELDVEVFLRWWHHLEPLPVTHELMGVEANLQ